VPQPLDDLGDLVELLPVAVGQQDTKPTLGEIAHVPPPDESTPRGIDRTRNEWIEEANDRFETLGDYEFLCECSDEHCTSTVSLSREDYETVRAMPTRFVIALNHENPEIDQPIVELQRFAIIQKLPGEPALLALETDPRA
jgi:hypothetical protein